MVTIPSDTHTCLVVTDSGVAELTGDELERAPHTRYWSMYAPGVAKEIE